MTELELLDPRTDPEPAYWPSLRARAGLRADWKWDLLAAQAWGSRSPLLVTVLHADGEPAGVASGSYTGIPFHRKTFVPVASNPVAGVLHVRSPGSSAVPGMWFDEALSLRDFLRAYSAGVRRTLGFGCVGLLLRQLTDPELAVLPRIKLARPTEPVWRLDAQGWSERDDWLRGLHKKRRSNLRVLRRTLDADDRIGIETTAASTADAHKVGDLLRHNEEKYGGALSALPTMTGYLSRLLSDEDVRTTTYTDRETGRLLGVGTVLDHPQWPVWRHWSMVPVDQGGVRNLYFHHITTLVDWAIETGKHGVVLGKGKAEVKESVGATSTEQYAVAVPLR